MSFGSLHRGKVRPPEHALKRAARFVVASSPPDRHRMVDQDLVAHVGIGRRVEQSERSFA